METKEICDDDKNSEENGIRNENPLNNNYCGRLAPTPSGYLHLGHAKTFWIAQERAFGANLNSSSLILRIEDLDGPRCKEHYYDDMIADMIWFGFKWTHGPQLAQQNEGEDSASDIKKQRVLYDASNSNIDPRHNTPRVHIFHGLDMTPYSNEYRQSKRLPVYRAAMDRLVDLGVVYPSPHSRKDVMKALSAPNEGDEEIIFPPSLRPEYMQTTPPSVSSLSSATVAENRRSIYPEEFRSVSFTEDATGVTTSSSGKSPNKSTNTSHHSRVNWRFRVPDGEVISFIDGNKGQCTYTAGSHFGDFLVWRSDGYPSYELAVVVDDITMGVTEVVRGSDLLMSTARQLLLYRALLPGLTREILCSSLCSSDDLRQDSNTTITADATAGTTRRNLSSEDSSKVYNGSSSSNNNSSISNSDSNIAILSPPSFYHCDLVRDKDGKRLAKRMQLQVRTDDQAPLSLSSSSSQSSSLATSSVSVSVSAPVQMVSSQDEFTLKALRTAGYSPDNIRRDILGMDG